VVDGGGGVVVVVDDEDIISWLLLSSSSSFLALTSAAMIRLVGGDNDKNYLDTCGLVDCRMHYFYFFPLSPALASRS